MNKQKQIEEMAKEIEKAKKHIWASVMPQAEYEDYLWHSRAIAEHLMLQGYRKLPEDSVVLSMEEYDEIKTYQSYIPEMKKAFDKIRNAIIKETAEEIIDMLIPNCEVCDENWHKGCLCLRATIAEKIAKQYGVEVENDG